MKRVAVVGLEKNNAGGFFNTFKDRFKKRDIEFVSYINTEKDEKHYEMLDDKGFRPGDFIAAVSAGGDGTFLYTSRVFAGSGVPVFGINKGHLGFNTNIEEAEFEKYFSKFLDGKAEFDYKHFLEVLLPENNERHIALNDGVISYAGISRTIRLRVNIGDTPLCNIRGDGLIVSTPTGSTAYNLSAGGPILQPEVNAFVLTAICPLSLAIRPFIIPFGEVITVFVDEPTFQITLDGQKIIYLNSGEKIVMKKSEKEVKIVRGSRSFSEILKIKLGWMV
jgi:NAD+ kinase